MAQNEIKKDEPSAAATVAAPSANANSAAPSTDSLAPGESKLRLVLPDNIDTNTDEDEEADAAWLEE